MRTIDAQMAGGLVELVLHRVGRHDLDVGVDNGGCLRARDDAMPRMRLEELGEEIVQRGVRHDALASQKRRRTGSTNANALTKRN